MKEYDWNLEKDKELKASRGIGFEEVVYEISIGRLIETVKHPNQKMFIVEISDYICYVPFIESETTYFLKTIIPSRKLNKKYKK